MALRKASQVNETTIEDSQPKINPEIDRKIDAFIKENPKQFDCYNALPKEHLVRVAILKDIQAQERTERTRSAILKKLDSDPEMKKSVETLVRNLPDEKKRTALANIASRTFRMQARQSKPKPDGPSTITPGG